MVDLLNLPGLVAENPPAAYFAMAGGLRHDRRDLRRFALAAQRVSGSSLWQCPARVRQCASIRAIWRRVAPVGEKGSLKGNLTKHILSYNVERVGDRDQLGARLLPFRTLNP